MRVIIEGVEYVPRIKLNENDTMPLRKLFAKARAVNKMTIREVAERTGLCTSAVYNSECYGTLGLITVLKLCELYGVDFESAARCILNELRKEKKP